MLKKINILLKKKPHVLSLLLIFLLILIVLGFFLEIGYRLWLFHLMQDTENASDPVGQMPLLTEFLLQKNLGLHNYYIMFTLMITLWWPFVMIFFLSVHRHNSIARIQSSFNSGACIIWMSILLILNIILLAMMLPFICPCIDIREPGPIAKVIQFSFKCLPIVTFIFIVILFSISYLTKTKKGKVSQ